MAVVLQRARIGRSRPALVRLDHGDPINAALAFCLIADGLNFYDVGPSRFGVDATAPTTWERVPTSFGLATRTNQTRIAPIPASFAQLQPAGPYTAMIRAGWRSTDNLGEAIFFSFTNGSSWSRGILFYANGLSGDLLRVRFIHSYGQALVSDYVIPCNGVTLSTIIGTFDGTTRRLWINGVFAAELASSAPDWTSIGNNTWSIGNNGGGYAAITTWEQARLWNRVLTPGEIARLSRSEPHAGLRSGPSLFRRDAGQQTAPEIAVTGNGNNIADGDATPSSTDHTDFGTITEGGATVSRTFTVSNSGDGTLTISSVTVPTGYTVTTALPGTIAAGGNAPLVVRLDSATPGTKSGDITINNDDADEGTFNFAVTGTVTAINPEIAVTGNGVNIGDGDNTPSATDHTDFGTTGEGTTKSRTFTVTNSGDENLVISSVALSGAGAAQFTITADPTGTIAPAGTAPLTVRADAGTQGTFTATVTINSDDADEAVFNFDVTVEVTEPVVQEDIDGGLLSGALGAVQMRRNRRPRYKGYF